MSLIRPTGVMAMEDNVKSLARPSGIVIHHSATRDTESLSYNAIRKYHMDGRNWDEIGYHYLLELVNNDIMTFTGRGLQYHGAHTIDRNDMIGICVVGNYDEIEPSNGHVEALVRLLVSIMALYPYLTVADIHYHSETAMKTCPGTKFPQLSMLKAWVDVKRKYL